MRDNENTGRTGTEPMSWQKEIDELRRREALAKRMGGEEKVARHHNQGKLTVRERIDAPWSIPTPSARSAPRPASASMTRPAS